MSEIVLGIGTSHGPLLSTPPEAWDLRADVDRRNPALAYRRGTYDFATLAALRRDGRFDAQNALPVRAERFARCQHELDRLSERLVAAQPDVVVVVGDDQDEWFRADIQPPFAIFHGETVVNRALTEDERARRIANGGEYSIRVYFPPQDERYPCARELGARMVAQAMADELDVTSCREQPHDAGVLRPLGHAFGFVYRRLLCGRPIPIVPVLINTYFPPNQPSARRCFAFGRSLGRAIRSWDDGKRVAVVASGGVSHFVIDEAFDQRMLAALAQRDWDALTGEPEYMFRSGSSETKNWIAVAGMLSETRLRMDLLGYVPCYRSEAGTGNAMAFVAWQ